MALITSGLRTSLPKTDVAMVKLALTRLFQVVYFSRYLLISPYLKVLFSHQLWLLRLTYGK